MNPVTLTMQKMMANPQNNLHDINHLLKVYGYAKTIGELESLPPQTQRILEVAALVHDIACPLCRQKYGYADGAHQQTEGEPMARAFLQDTGLSPDEIERVAYLVGHHHTLEGIDGIDWQILLEADYLVNADENGASKPAIENTLCTMYRTPSGSALLRAIYLREE